MSITQSNMPNSNRPRLSISPEKLILAKIVYSVESDCARTFFIVGDCVVWSHHPHLQIISGGGVHSRTCLVTAQAAGLDGLLIASALHDGRLTPDDLTAVRSVGASDNIE